MWRQIQSYQDAIGSARCLYCFVENQRVLGIWLTPHFGSNDEGFSRAVAAHVDSLLASGYHLYIAELSEAEWLTAPQRLDGYLEMLQTALHRSFNEDLGKKCNQT